MRITLMVVAVLLSGCGPELSVDGNWTLQIASQAGVAFLTQTDKNVTGFFRWPTTQGSVSGHVGVDANQPKDSNDVHLVLEYASGAQFILESKLSADGKHLSGQAFGRLNSTSSPVPERDWQYAFPRGEDLAGAGFEAVKN